MYELDFLGKNNVGVFDLIQLTEKCEKEINVWAAWK